RLQRWTGSQPQQSMKKFGFAVASAALGVVGVVGVVGVAGSWVKTITCCPGGACATAMPALITRTAIALDQCFFIGVLLGCDAAAGWSLRSIRNLTIVPNTTNVRSVLPQDDHERQMALPPKGGAGGRNQCGLAKLGLVGKEEVVDILSPGGIG